MKTTFTLLSLLFIAFTGISQDLNLRNALVVSHIDNQQDRFTLEVAVSEVLSQNGVKNAVSLNLVKQGGDPQVLLTDSIKQILDAQGINTFMVVSIRGYDRKFKTTTKQLTLAEDLAADNLFSLYKPDIVSVSMEFHFYREGRLVYADIIKIGGVSSRESVMKKFRRKLSKRVRKWK
jgi:hypothetical protein